MIDLNDEQKNTLFQTLHVQWIQPEIEKRFGNNGPPDTFRILKYLVKLPKNREPIIQFNEEFGWLVPNPEMPMGRTLDDLNIGERITLSDIIKITNVLPPTVDGERVAFVFLSKQEKNTFLYFDFDPNDPDYTPDKEQFKFDGSAIAAHLQRVILNRVVDWAKQHETLLSKIGLWIATPLFPYPLSKIVEYIEKQNLEQAREVLVQYCNIEFISSKLVGTWHYIQAFNERHQLFNDALFLHKDRRFHGCITILVCQIEGVIVEWFYEINPSAEIAKKTADRIKQFRDLLKTIPDFAYPYQIAFDSLFALLQEAEGAKLFQKFSWTKHDIDPNFPSRHAITHGKYVPEIYTEENSIKLFLLLDTICQFMIFYEIQVLGKNLSQTPPS